MKRIISVLLSAMLVLAVISAEAFAAEVRTVYMDPASGLDTNNGLTEAAPIQSLAAAYAALEGAEEGKIVLLSTLTLTEATTFPSCDIPVTITGSGITTGNNIYFGGDTTLDSMTLTLTASNNSTYLSSEGHDLTIGKNLVCKNGGSGYRFCLTTRHGEGSVDGATLTVKTGNWRNVFAAGYTKATTGNARLIMTGGNVSNMVGPTYSGSLTGNVTMEISGATIGSICAAPNQTGTVTGNVDITLGSGVSGKLRIKRLHENATVNGTATVTINGDCSGLTEIAHVGSGVGDIAKTRLVLKSGVLNVTPCAFDDVALEIPQGKTMTLNGCAINATTVNCAGTLQFTGKASLAATAITGTLNCDITDTPLVEHAYVKAPAGSAVIFPTTTGVKENNGIWRVSSGEFDAENFKGLVLYTTVDGITVELYKDFSTDAANLVTPAYTDGKYQYYAVKADDIYYGVSKPTNSSDKTRYELHQTFYISATEANQKVEFDMTPGVRSTEGWETVEAVCRFTDEVMQKAFPSDAKSWSQYQEIFTTPAFQPGRTAHRQTTQQEMETFLKDLDDPDDNIYVFSLGKTAMGSFDIPLVLVTSVELPADVTLEQAAALIRADSEQNGKVTVHYQAQIHGDEPAAGEAALGMIKRLDGEYGEGLLDSLNIYVIPRLNPYGAYKGKRITWINSSTYVDPNRDFLKLETSETQLRMKAFNMFEPEVVFDNHEYRFNLETKAVTKRDMMVCSHILPTYSDTYKEAAIDLAYAAFDQLKADNLTYSWYSSDAQNYSISSVSGGVGSGNTAFRGTMHILMETLGNNYGKNLYERRVASHVSAVTGILNHLDANAAEVKAVVKAQRETIVENGKTYKEDDVVILKSAANYHPEYNITGTKVNLRNGGEVAFTFEARMADTIVNSRIAPTAYVIPAGESFTKTVLDLMDKQGIFYKFIPAGSAMQLQQYQGDTTTATLTEEKLVTFPDGAYVFSMNQVDSLILSVYMEPDVSHSSGLAKMGIINPIDGVFPIYRYIHDLNEDDFVDYTTAPAAPAGLSAVGATAIGGTGKITGLDATKAYEYRLDAESEYTAVAIGATEITALPVGNYLVRYCATQNQLPSVDAQITVGYALGEYVVYLDSTSGSDAANAYTKDAAAATYSYALKQLDAIIEYAPAGTTGQICIVGTYTISGAQKLPKHSYPLLITGGTLTFTATESQKYLRMGGDTTFDNITLKMGSSNSAYYLCGDGYKFTIGKNVSTPANSGNYFNLMAGSGAYSNTTYVASTDMTVLSGTWQNVYAGGYVSSVTGDAKAVLSGCSVNRITGSYNGNIKGNAYYSLENVVVRENEIYCGNIQKNNISGDVTMVLGTGVNVSKVYAGSKTAGDIGGTVTIIADGIDLTATTIYGKANNATGIIGGLKLVLNQGQLPQVVDSFVTREDVLVQLGCDQENEVVLDSSFIMDLNGCNASGITVAEGNTLTVYDSSTDDYVVMDEQGYGILSATGNVAAKEGYRAYAEASGKSYQRFELTLCSVTLRPVTAGIYYTGNFQLNDLQRRKVQSYGVVLSTKADPRLGKEGCIASVITDWNESGKGFGTLLNNIMKEDNTDEYNARNAGLRVYGIAYIQYNDGTVEYSNTACYTLRYLVEKIDTIWPNLSADQSAGLIAMYKKYADVMESWNISNLKSAC